MISDISVIICTHNPRSDYLTRVLAALRQQTLPTDRWELLVIDNASKEPVVDRFDVSWHPHGRHVREDELGLTPARLRGIAEAHGEILVFVDDDNLLDADFLEQAMRISKEYPFLGAWGGNIRPEFETEPPEWTKPYWPMLAIVSIEKDIWSNLTETLITSPCGAGMCVRKTVADTYQKSCSLAKNRLDLDRKGKSLMSCGDSDLALTACDLGLGMGRFTRLNLTHIIPASRLTLDYLGRLAEDMTYSHGVLQAFRRLKRVHPPRRLVGRLIDSYHRIRLSKEHRHIYDARVRGNQRVLEIIVEVS